MDVWPIVVIPTPRQLCNKMIAQAMQLPELKHSRWYQRHHSLLIELSRSVSIEALGALSSDGKVMRSCVMWL